jgi:hypothetical protein
MTRARSVITLLLPVLLFAASAASCAPRAREIRGDVAEEIRQGIAGGTATFDHSAFDALLAKHVDEEAFRVNYRGLKQDEAALDAYLTALDHARLASLGRDELFALFLNAYNAYTLKTILRTMTPERPDGVPSIREIPSVFSRSDHRVGGHILSLDNIEHNILRPLFRDPRIHFAVNCAAVSCPPLGASAFVAARVDEQLEAAARRTLGSPAYARVEDGRLVLTKVLDWYGSDFTDKNFAGHAASLPEYVARYAADEVREFIEGHNGRPPVRFLDYDWALNAKR